MERGADVQVLMTSAAARFVTPMTFHALTGRPPIADLFDPPEPAQVAHIELAEAASLVVVAPCTANVLGKFAHGLADDVVTAVLMATRAPVLIAPAMNGRMYGSVPVQENVAILRTRGVHFIGPVTGKFAAPAEGEGEGRMSEPAEIVEAAFRLLGSG